jgi:type IV secretory pathway VirB10-like protein
MLPVWTRLLMPDGRSVVLERHLGADTQGLTGLGDDSDYNLGQLLIGACRPACSASGPNSAPTTAVP